MPEPDGPTIAVVVPGCSAKLTPSEHRRACAVIAERDVLELDAAARRRGRVGVSVPAAMTGALSTERIRSRVARVLSNAGPSSLIDVNGSR